jgi:hypothetical protein
MAHVNAKDIAYSPQILDQWIVDRRASHLMTSCWSNFSNYSPDSTTVTLANHSITKAARWGDVVLLPPSEDNTLKDVLHIPSLGVS